mgnify:CR=1 FL=1
MEVSHIMLAFFLAPLYILINIYIVRWMILWMGACTLFSRPLRSGYVLWVFYIFSVHFSSDLFFLSGSRLKSIVFPEKNTAKLFFRGNVFFYIPDRDRKLLISAD